MKNPKPRNLGCTSCSDLSSKLHRQVAVHLESNMFPPFFGPENQDFKRNWAIDPGAKNGGMKNDLHHVICSPYFFQDRKMRWNRHERDISKLVGGAITILKNMKVNGKDDIPYILWKIKNVWNHQPVFFLFFNSSWPNGYKSLAYLVSILVSSWFLQHQCFWVIFWHQSSLDMAGRSPESTTDKKKPGNEVWTKWISSHRYVRTAPTSKDTSHKYIATFWNPKHILLTMWRYIFG